MLVSLGLLVDDLEQPHEHLVRERGGVRVWVGVRDRLRVRVRVRVWVLARVWIRVRARIRARVRVRVRPGEHLDHRKDERAKGHAA